MIPYNTIKQCPTFIIIHGCCLLLLILLFLSGSWSRVFLSHLPIRALSYRVIFHFFFEKFPTCLPLCIAYSVCTDAHGEQHVLNCVISFELDSEPNWHSVAKYQILRKKNVWMSHNVCLRMNCIIFSHVYLRFHAKISLIIYWPIKIKWNRLVCLDINSID